MRISAYEVILCSRSQILHYVQNDRDRMIFHPQIAQMTQILYYHAVQK